MKRLYNKWKSTSFNQIKLNNSFNSTPFGVHPLVKVHLLLSGIPSLNFTPHFVVHWLYRGKCEKCSYVKSNHPSCFLSIENIMAEWKWECVCCVFASFVFCNGYNQLYKINVLQTIQWHSTLICFAIWTNRERIRERERDEHKKDSVQ